MKKPSQNALKAGVGVGLLVALLTLPFAVAGLLLAQQRLTLLDTYQVMQEDVAWIEQGLELLPPLDNVRDLAPVMIHTQGEQVEEQFAQNRRRVDRKIVGFLQTLRRSDRESLHDQAAMLEHAWRDLTVKTGIPMENVAGPFENVERFSTRYYNVLATILYISNMSAGEGLEPNEVLSLPLGTFRQVRHEIGMIRALAMYVSRRGGYLSGADVGRLEGAMQELGRQVALIDSEIQALVDRTGATRLQQQWRLVRGQLTAYLAWAQEQLIVQPTVDIRWQQAFERGQRPLRSLHDLSLTLVSLSDQMLVHAYDQAKRRSWLMALAIGLLYLLVVGLALLFYRANYRAISARAESLARGQFLARMSHEIRTPLNGVVGLAELLRDTNPSARQQEYIRLINSAGSTLKALVNNVLDYAKLEAGKLELDNTAFDLPALVVECARMFNLPASDNHTLVLVDVDPATPMQVVGDATRLRQVLINLLSNAVKFSRGGRVVLSVQCHHRENQPAQLCFAVSDTGIGMNEEEIAGLFQRFSQASAKTSRQSGGTGLGLSISHELVELMGGDIDVESAPGLGTRFQFSLSLPVDAPAVPMMAQEPPASLLWDVQANLSAWIRDDSRFQPVQVIAQPGDLTALQETGQEPSSLVINGMPEPALLEEALQLKQLHYPQLPLVLRVGMRTSLPPNLSDQVTVLQRSVFTVAELQQVFAGHGNESATQALQTSRNDTSEVKDALPVIVAEDNPVNQMVTRGYLERLGVTSIQVCDDGLQAFQHFQDADGAVRLVLMDLDMPVMDGFECAAAMRELEQRKGWVPCSILALSAHALADHAERIRACGMNGQLIKPISLPQMEAALADC